MKNVFPFLKKLKKNNQRDWFQTNKDKYVMAHEEVIDFADQLLEEMKSHDRIETVSGKKSLFRIYRDVRFSKNKAPYKTHFSGSFRRATESLRGGYYFHIEPGNSFVAGGFWAPNKEDLKRIRDEFEADDSEMRAIMKDRTFKRTFGELYGDAVKTAPRGYDKEHPAIDLIRMKQFLVTKEFPDKVILSKNGPKKFSETFQKMRPFFDFMSEVLTTDLNGQPIL